MGDHGQCMPMSESPPRRQASCLPFCVTVYRLSWSRCKHCNPQAGQSLITEPHSLWCGIRRFDVGAEAYEKAADDPDAASVFERRGVPPAFLRALGEVAAVWPTLPRVLLDTGETAIILKDPNDPAESHGGESADVAGGAGAEGGCTHGSPPTLCSATATACGRFSPQLFRTALCKSCFEPEAAHSGAPPTRGASASTATDTRQPADAGGAAVAALPAQIRSLQLDVGVVHTYRYVDPAAVVATIPAAVGERLFFGESDVGVSFPVASARGADPGVGADAPPADAGAVVGPEGDDPAVLTVPGVGGAGASDSDGDGDSECGSRAGSEGLDGLLDRLMGGDDDSHDPAVEAVLTSLQCGRDAMPYPEWCPDRCGTVLSLSPTTMTYSVARSPAAVDSTGGLQANHHSLAGYTVVELAVGAAVADTRFTTKDVCAEVILPLTRLSKRSVVEVLADAAARLGPAAPFGPPAAATVFLSHAWIYVFVDFAAAVELWLSQSADGGPGGAAGGAEVPPGPHSLWIDIATVPQHREAQRELAPDFFYNQFMDGIKTIGRMVSVMWPVHAPIPVTRSWCVWEIWCSMTSGVEFETALTPRDQTRLLTSSGGSGLPVSVRDATAWDPRDAARILAACETVGCDEIDRRVQEAFGVDQVRRALARHASPPPAEAWVDFISLSSLRIDDAACRLLAAYTASSARPISTVLFWTCAVSRVGFTAIAEAVGRCRGLGRVLIYNNRQHQSTPGFEAGPLPPDAAAAAAEWGFGGAAVPALARALCSNPAVTTVQLAGTAMSSAEFGALAAAALGPSSTVRDLSVTQHAGLLAGGSPGAKGLAAALRVNTALRQLDLGHTDLDTAAASELAAAVGSNPGSALAVVEAGGGNPDLTAAGIQALRRAMLPAMRRAADAVPSPPAPPDPANPDGAVEAEKSRLAWITEPTDRMEKVLALHARTEAEVGQGAAAAAAYHRLLGWMEREIALGSDCSLADRRQTYVDDLAAVGPSAVAASAPPTVDPTVATPSAPPP
eukprot:m.395474 g.395474  ORF g.395474 m.395474 type:complete len:1017 (-) comp28352_c2_seq7:6083-9133(-)